MRNEPTTTEAGRDYTAAYAMHYKTKDLHGALDLYEGVMSAYPDTHEATYSRTQIQNIAKSVVPVQELVDAEMEMAREHLEHDGQAVGEPAKEASPKL